MSSGSAGAPLQESSSGSLLMNPPEGCYIHDLRWRQSCKTRSYLRKGFCINVICDNYYLKQKPSYGLWQRGEASKKQFWTPEEWKTSMAPAVEQKQLALAWYEEASAEELANPPWNTQPESTVTVEEVVSSSEEQEEFVAASHAAGRTAEIAASGFQAFRAQEKANEYLAAAVKLEKGDDGAGSALCQKSMEAFRKGQELKSSSEEVPVWADKAASYWSSKGKVNPAEIQGTSKPFTLDPTPIINKRRSKGVKRKEWIQAKIQEAKEKNTWLGGPDPSPQWKKIRQSLQDFERDSQGREIRGRWQISCVGVQCVCEQNTRAEFLCRNMPSVDMSICRTVRNPTSECREDVAAWEMFCAEAHLVNAALQYLCESMKEMPMLALICLLLLASEVVCPCTCFFLTCPRLFLCRTDGERPNARPLSAETTPKHAWRVY